MDCIIYDDMIDTGGTLCAAAKDLKKFGAKKVYCFASHGIFSTGKPAIDKIENSCLDSVIVTDTIPIGTYEKKSKKIIRIDSGKFYF